MCRVQDTGMHTPSLCVSARARVCVCVCVCARARARVRACVCVCACVRVCVCVCVVLRPVRPCIHSRARVHFSSFPPSRPSRDRAHNPDENMCIPFMKMLIGALVHLITECGKQQ